MNLHGSMFRASAFLQMWGMCTQEIQLPAEERLLPKVHVNLGITLEADGCLSAACDHYRYNYLPDTSFGFAGALERSIKLHACNQSAIDVILQGGSQAGAKPLQGA